MDMRTGRLSQRSFGNEYTRKGIQRSPAAEGREMIVNVISFEKKTSILVFDPISRTQWKEANGYKPIVPFICFSISLLPISLPNLVYPHKAENATLSIHRSNPDGQLTDRRRCPSPGCIS